MCIVHLEKMTKIIATIGPVSDSRELIQEFIESGVNIFRFNMKHNKPSWHLERIKRVQNIADTLKVHVGILIDLQGPEIRIDTENKDVYVDAGEHLVLTSNDTIPKEYSLGKHKVIRLNHKVVLKTLQVGDKFSIDDGLFEFKVVDKVTSSVLLVKSFQKGVIKHRKSLNLVGLDVVLPSLISEDLDKLDMATKTKVDFVALSFTRSKKDIQVLRKEMETRKLDAQIVAKIENKSGVDNIEDIIEHADAIMIARGDLGIEIPMEEIPYLQKEIIKKCRDANKPVIVATQMLQSMIENTIPTRAEAADVANAVFDETDAVMLSGETASGKYPLKAVKYMKKLVQFNEGKKDGAGYTVTVNDQTHAIVRAALSMTKKDAGVKVDKVLVFTQSGYTARVFSSFRPNIPIIALSEKEKTVGSLTMSYGIVPFLGKFPEDSFTYTKLFTEIKRKGFLKEKDLVIVVHGKRWQDEGKTNALVVLTV